MGVLILYGVGVGSVFLDVFFDPVDGLGEGLFEGVLGLPIAGGFGEGVVAD